MGRLDYALLYRVAYLYYEEQLSQNEISKLENISRPHVSRLLTKAREVGIVNIEVTCPSSIKINETAIKVASKLDLKNVYVTPINEYQFSDENILVKTISTFSASKVSDFIKDGQVIGVGWGRTIYQTSILLERSEFNNSTIVPLVGLVHEPSPYLQSSIIVDRFSEKLNAKSFYTSIPVVNMKSKVLNADEKKRFNELTTWWDKVDLAIIGIGGPFIKNSNILTDTSEEYQELVENSNTVGDILTNYFYKNGKVFDTKRFYNQVAIPLNKLKEIPEVVCIGGGASKVEAIKSAAKSGYISTLITDAITAELLLK